MKFDAIPCRGRRFFHIIINHHLSLICHFLPLPSQADLNCNIQEESGAFYGVTSQYESSENMTITCSTKVCSFGKQVVEKVEVRKCWRGKCGLAFRKP